MLKLSNSLFKTDYTWLNEMYALTKSDNPDHITFPVLEVRYVETTSNQFDEQFAKIETEKKMKIYDNNPLMEIKNISVDDKKKCIENVIQYGVFIGGRIECFTDKYKITFDYSDNVNNIEDFLPGFLLFGSVSLTV